MNKISHRLQIKVFAALAILLFGSTSIVLYLNLLAEDNFTNQELMSLVRQVEVQGQAIKRRAATYARHAPRDYAPYERDVIIFYPDFTADLLAFDQGISTLVTVANKLPQGNLYSDKSAIIDSIANLQTQWHTFQQGLQEKLGDNANEPRLEWGAEYVEENQALINDIADMLTMSIDMAIQTQLAINKRLSSLAISAAGSLLILGVIWFYLRVVRRISQTINGCQRVAQGDFGYQLPLHGADELTALARAFNILSARTLFVMTMLSKMHRHGSAESKVDALWQEASGYLPIQWLGLWQLNSNDKTLSLMSMRSNRSIRGRMQEALLSAANRDPHLHGLINRGKPVKYDDLNAAASQLATARLFKEIVKLGLLKSALIVPLQADDGWQGLLVFIASEASAYTREQLQLMGNLSPFMANGFAQSAKENLTMNASLSSL